MKWEYLVDWNYEIATLLDQQRYLDEKGQYEWELVTLITEEMLIHGTKTTTYCFYFKRRIEINPKLREAQLKEVPQNDNDGGSSEAAGAI